MKEFVKNNKYNIIVCIILIIGIAVRIIGIDKLPNGLNTDEASAGYEAYSILNYGIDRNNNFMPSFLVAWGSRSKCIVDISDNTICKYIRT